MQLSRIRRSLIGVLCAARGIVGCSDGSEQRLVQTDPLGSARAALSFDTRLARCLDDPRVVAGLVSSTVCAGASVFFEETFDGNGRTCGSCHPAENNTTLDPEFVAALHASTPDDPLFIAENDPELANLETPDLLGHAGILENLDGFSDPTQRFVSRTVSHVLSLRTSLRPDPRDGTANPPSERTGWSGDGSRASCACSMPCSTSISPASASTPPAPSPIDWATSAPTCS